MARPNKEQLSALIVENNHLNREDIRTDITQASLALGLPPFRFDEEVTEHGFRQRLPSLRMTPPDLVVSGLFVPWTHPAPEMPVPTPDVIEGGSMTAGIRIEAKLHEQLETARVPFILYSVFSQDDLRDPNWYPSGLPAYTSQIDIANETGNSGLTGAWKNQLRKIFHR